ncbi:MAG: HAD-IA family hydrolase [Thermoplasmata archaeon]|nr:HAD-IA family hydrolase [Thermoplasmata archaeon]
MGSTEEFLALSLDLGETVWWDAPQHAARQAQARARTLSGLLIGPTGRGVDAEEVAAAEQSIRVELEVARRGFGTLSMPHRVADVAHRLHARLSVSLKEAVSRFASAGLDSDPPTINPQARRLVESLNHRKFPVIAISNTQRTGEAWRTFLRSAGLRFEFVITSSDYETAKPDPQLFRVAAERLGRAPGEVLHIGDRWATDVVGALSVRMGAALYRGLWSKYWNPEDGPPTDPGGHPEVYRWDDLGQAERTLEDRSEGY